MMYLSSLLTLLVSLVSEYRPADVDPSLRPADVPLVDLKPSYDFIIVGAGSAGSVVANRLSEVEEWKVLLIEAGGDEDVISDTPLLAPFLQKTSRDWNYTTVEQQNACRALGGICQYPRGLMLGGSSSTNYLLYVRGHKNDYDNWEAMGNEGWGWDDVLPYFKKSEDIQVEELKGSENHGQGGYLTVKHSEYKSELSDAFAAALQDMGYQEVDYNDGIQTGYGTLQLTARGPSRCSTAKGFLRPAKDRKNLDIIQYSMVTKIVIEDGVAKGVEFVKDGQTVTAAASKEVILSAGSFNSAKLLMLSGIGPKEHLEELGIPVVRDLPVGSSCHDHIYVNLSYSAENVDLRFKSIFNEQTVQEYAERGQGPLTLPVGIEMLAYLRSGLQESERPDMMIFMYSYPVVFSNVSKFLLGGGQAVPLSAGTLRLRSSDPMDPPLIDPGYFQDPVDVQTGIEICKTSLKMARSKAFAKYSPKVIDTTCPQENDDEFCACVVPTDSTPIVHFSGSAKMGVDEMSVVDPQLKVLGVQGLRVVDASIMPLIPSANTNAPTIMIAEKGSDIIKQTWAP